VPRLRRFWQAVDLAVELAADVSADGLNFELFAGLVIDVDDRDTGNAAQVSNQSLFFDVSRFKQTQLLTGELLVL
jgi:hypothetical protein